MSQRHPADRNRLRHPSHGGSPYIPVDLGTGVLTAMRINSGLEELKPRLALRAQLPLHWNYQQGDARMRAILLARHGHAVPHINSDFSFDVPIDIDMMEDVTPTYSMSDVTREEAHLHGYASPERMRHALGFKKGENGTIFSYKILVPTIAENDLALAGERANMTRAAYEAFRGAKGDKIIINASGNIRQSREKSIQGAREFLGTLPSYAALIGEASITPRKHLEKAQLVPFAAEPQEVSRSREALLVRTTEKLHKTYARLTTEQDPHAHSRLRRHANKLHETVMRLSTPQWVPTAVATLRAAQDDATENPRTTRKRSTVAKAPATQAVPVNYASDFGKRGQYTDKDQRPQMAAPAILSDEEQRAVKHSKETKRKWRDRVARAAFGVGEDLPTEPALLQTRAAASVAPKRTPRPTKAQLAREDHLFEEDVPTRGPFDIEEYLSYPRDGGGYER